jgi:prepilin peptidase CpaA
MWLPFYLVRVLGAGDVKFFAAASTWLGASSAVLAALLAALCGAVLSVAWIIARRRPAARPLPYAIAMAVGLGLSAWLP